MGTDAIENRSTQRPEQSDGAAKTDVSIESDGVAIAVSRAGHGRPLLLCPGLFTTRADLEGLTEDLRDGFEVTTFDLRGHGRSAAADQYRFADFLGDFAAVATQFDRAGSAPVLVGHSLGADLAVHYAAEHPGTVAGLVLIDGANPLPEPFLSETEIPQFRAMAEQLRHALEPVLGTERQILLTPGDFIDVNLEIDAIRSSILDQYLQIECPIHVIASTAMAGSDSDERTRRRNGNWKSGFERLVRARPRTEMTWIDGGHDVVLTHAAEIARTIRAFSATRA